MEMIIVTLVLVLVFGAFLFIPKSQNKGKSEVTRQYRKMEKALKAYTKEEIFHHNTRKDCWIIIKDKVYDVTPYVEVHPGGDAILTHAGGDATEGFYGPQHASLVFDMVDEFYIGDLKS